MYLFLFKSNVRPRQSKYQMTIALDFLVCIHEMQKKVHFMILLEI